MQEPLSRGQPLDIHLLDSTVENFYTGDSITRKQAELTLTAFQNQPDSWQHVAAILETSSSLHTKFLALRILDDFITVRWHTVPLDTRLEIRNYIVQRVILLSSDPNLDTFERPLLTKLNMLVIQIVKKDWLQHWPTFISELVTISQSNLSLCENSMRIFKLLSEEVFDYSQDQLTIARTRKLKAQLIKEAGLVFDLCQQVLVSQSTPPTLVSATLETLSRFLNWLPHSYISEGSVIRTLESLITSHRNPVLECYTTIASLKVTATDDESYERQIICMYDIVSAYYRKILPRNQDLSELYRNAHPDNQLCVYNVTNFLVTALSNHLLLLNTRFDSSLIHSAHVDVLGLSRIEDSEIWKTCLDYWEKLSSQQDPISVRYTQLILDPLRQLILDRMVAPVEILLVENDDDGEVTKEYIKESDTTVLFNSMKSVLLCLKVLDAHGTMATLHSRLLSIVQSNQWTWANLNKICWAIGSLSGRMNGHDESIFLSTAIGNLIQLLESSSLKNDGSIYAVTSCLVYIGTQYVDFIDSHPHFLDLILKRLLAYMHDSVSDVRDMACDSFLKLCQGCSQALANKIISNDDEASVMWIVIRNISTIIKDLNTQQISLVFRATGYLIATLSAPTDQNQALDELADVTGMYLNLDWNNIKLERGSGTIDRLKSVLTAIKINYAICESTGLIYQRTFYRFLIPFTSIYQATSQFLLSAEGAAESVEKSLCQKIKVEIQRLTTQVFSSKSDTKIVVMDDRLYHLLRVMLEDYRTVSPNADATVLSMMATLLDNVEIIWPQSLELILQTLFEPTLTMINRNFCDYPRHRSAFYRLLHSMNRKYFRDLLHLLPSQLSIFVDCILWGTKHTVDHISHVALRTCLEMINLVSQLDDEDIASEFYQAYYLRILTEILTVLVDVDCQNGFIYQSEILARLLELVQEGEIYTQVFDVTSVDNPLMSNAAYLQDYVQQFFTHSFPLLQRDQIEVLVLGMFEYSDDLERFQSDLRDFLIDIRQVDDAEAGLQRRQEEDNAALELLRYT